MTWDQFLTHASQAVTAIVGVIGAWLLIRGLINSNAKDGGVLHQRVDGHESRLSDVEHLVAGIGADREAIRALKQDVATVTSDVRDLGKGQTALMLQLAVIPEHLKRIEDQSKSNQEATTHSLRNLRSGIEAIARRAGMIAPSDT